MANRDEVNRLRNQVKNARERANNKVSRLRRNKDVSVAGTKYDPRRTPGIENSYNSTQLRRYLFELNSFTSRHTQFVAGSGGKPSPSQAWNKFADAMRRYNDQSAYRMRGMENVPMKGSSQTYQEATEAKRYKEGRMAAGSFESVSFKPEHIASEKSLNKLTRHLESLMLDRATTNSRMNRARQKAIEMAEAVPNGSAIANQLKRITERQRAEMIREGQEVVGLTDRQFEALWNNPYFFDAIRLAYGSPQSQESADDADKDIANQQGSVALDLIGWVKTIA